jgi:hypothetical protein
MTHPLVGKTVRWTRGTSSVTGIARDTDWLPGELGIRLDERDCFWVPASECVEVTADEGVVPDTSADEREALARWLHMHMGRDRSHNWDALSDRQRTGWRDLAGEAPTRGSDTTAALQAKLDAVREWAHSICGDDPRTSEFQRLLAILDKEGND